MRKYIVGCLTLLTMMCYVNAQDQVTRCPFPFNEFKTGDLCGFLEVPQSYENPSAGTIKLAYLVIKSKVADPKPDPLVFLPGGPGGSVLTYADAYSGFSLSPDRDFVLIDPRGTGFSTPLCPILALGFFEVLGQNLTTEQEYAKMKQLLSDCDQGLRASGVNRDNFNTSQNVEDLERLREHLGYEKWNLFGGSYGTRWAVNYMTTYPERVRSAILQGVFPPEIRMYDNITTNFHNSVKKVFKSAKETFPNLETDFYAVYDELKANPYTFLMDGKYFTLNAQDFLLLSHFTLYSSTGILTYPAFVAAAKKKKNPELAFYIKGAGQLFSLVNLATYWTVMGSDEVHVDNEDRVSRDIANNPKLTTGMGLFANDYKVHDFWNVKSLQIEGMETNVLRTPTLLVSGTYDPITPPANAELLAKRITNSYHMVFADGSHSPINDCFFDLARQFLENPMQEPNKGCLDHRELKW